MAPLRIEVARIAGRDPQHSDDDLGEWRGGIHHRLCDRAKACTGFSHCMEDVRQVTGVAGSVEVTINTSPASSPPIARLSWGFSAVPPLTFS